MVQRMWSNYESVVHKYSLAENGAKELWKLVNEEPFINALGALSGNRLSASKANLKAVYLSGWQVQVMQTMPEIYPDQSLSC